LWQSCASRGGVCRKSTTSWADCCRWLRAAIRSTMTGIGSTSNNMSGTIRTCGSPERCALNVGRSGPREQWGHVSQNQERHGLISSRLSSLLATPRVSPSSTKFHAQSRKPCYEKGRARRETISPRTTGSPGPFHGPDPSCEPCSSGKKRGEAVVRGSRSAANGGTEYGDGWET